MNQLFVSNLTAGNQNASNAFLICSLIFHFLYNYSLTIFNWLNMWHFFKTSDAISIHTNTLFTYSGKSILQVPDTGTGVLDNTGPFLHSSIVSFWITPAHSKERKYHIFRQYWYTRNVPVFTNTGTFQYLGPEVYFFPNSMLRTQYKLPNSPDLRTPPF